MAGVNYKDELMAEIYREERMHEAEVDRLVRHANARKGKRIDLPNILRNWLGKQLILLGSYLQRNEMSRHTS